jgi:hypothetical protein
MIVSQIDGQAKKPGAKTPSRIKLLDSLESPQE